MSTYEKKLSIGSLTAGADLSAKFRHFVKMHTAANQVVAAGDGELAIGVLNNEPTSGQVAEIMVGVIVPVIAGAAVTVGAEIASDAAGKCVPAASTDRILGVALEAASGSGEEIRILFGHSMETKA